MKVELCSKASTEVEPPPNSKIVECKATAEQSKGVITKSHDYESRGHAIQIYDHCTRDMSPKAMETAGFSTNEASVKCQH